MNRLEKITIFSNVKELLGAYKHLLDTYNLSNTSKIVGEVIGDFDIFINEFLDESYAMGLKKEEE